VSVLDDDGIVDLFRQAWEESQPGTDSAHEEGGFVLRNPDGSLRVERWPRGAQNQILVPPHPGGKRGDLPIVATFHTHPNPGPEFQQEPSITDIRAVRDDVDLSHPDFEGEYVVATESIYRIDRNGRVELFGRTSMILSNN
jgi:hypothetical protein